MAEEKKRPRGLKNSALAKANKKSKTEETTTEFPENTQTIVIDKEVEEGDELGETAALLESALEKLESDPSEALTLIRGTIHESDRILRNWDSEEALPASFYYSYGAALYELGRLTDDEDFEQYLDMAEERLLQSQGDEEVKAKVSLALAKVWFAKAANQVEDDIPELATKALETANASVDSWANKDVVDLADIAQNHAALYPQLEQRTGFLNWAEKHLKEIVQDEPENAKALSILGLAKLQIVHYWLDNVNEDDDNDDRERTELSTEEGNAYKALLDCKEHLESSYRVLEQTNRVTPQVLFDLAEVYLNEANLVLDEQEQNCIYEKAIKNIKKSQSLIDEKKLEVVLPEGLVAFLEEYESSQQQ
ncbi:nuclear pore complex subunit Nro1-domain-containing protein [Sporodiniella umbellata]|nr:nuclear pore complex subunit Nro1-domain-containing protein [Sporodiniella umbellata]